METATKAAIPTPITSFKVAPLWIESPDRSTRALWQAARQEKTIDTYTMHNASDARRTCSSLGQSTMPYEVEGNAG